VRYPSTWVCFCAFSVRRFTHRYVCSLLMLLRKFPSSFSPHCVQSSSRSPCVCVLVCDFVFFCFCFLLPFLLIGPTCLLFAVHVHCRVDSASQHLRGPTVETPAHPAGVGGAEYAHHYGWCYEALCLRMYMLFYVLLHWAPLTSCCA
jgi:hypothetical protein